jgi:hypothetical protein
MTVARPGRYPYHAESLSTTLPTVAESVGFVAGTIADPNVVNALEQSGGRWDQYADLHKCQIEDIVSAAAPYLVRGQSLTYLVGASLGSNAPTNTPVIIGGGCRLAFDATVMDVNGLASVTFPASMRTWFYGSAPSVGSYPSIRTEAVALGVAATPAGSEVTLGGVDTNATKISANVDSDLADTLTLDVPIYFTEIVDFGDAVNAVAINTTGSITVGGALDVTGTTDLAGAVTCDTTLDVTGATTLNTLAVAGITTATGTLTTVGNTVIGTTSGDACTINATIDAPVTISINDAVNRCLTLVNADAGQALRATSTGGYAAFLVGDATSPDRAALHLSPQDADPSSFSEGDVLYQSARDTIRFRGPSGWRSTHNSSKGLVDGFAAGSSGTTINSGDLGSVTISAEETGSVLIEVSGGFSMASAANSYDLLIRDVTAAATVATVTIPVAVGGELSTQILRAVYTLPSSGSREFAMQVNGNGAANVTRSFCVVSVRGVQ